MPPIHQHPIVLLAYNILYTSILALPLAWGITTVKRSEASFEALKGVVPFIHAVKATSENEVRP